MEHEVTELEPSMKHQPCCAWVLTPTRESGRGTVLSGDRIQSLLTEFSLYLSHWQRYSREFFYYFCFGRKSPDILPLPFWRFGFCQAMRKRATIMQFDSGWRPFSFSHHDLLPTSRVLFWFRRNQWVVFSDWEEGVIGLLFVMVR
jgi:hypothetical protein